MSTNKYASRQHPSRHTRAYLLTRTHTHTEHLSLWGVGSAAAFFKQLLGLSGGPGTRGRDPTSTKAKAVTGENFPPKVCRMEDLALEDLKMVLFQMDRLQCNLKPLEKLTLDEHIMLFEYAMGCERTESLGGIRNRGALSLLKSGLSGDKVGRSENPVGLCKLPQSPQCKLKKFQRHR